MSRYWCVFFQAEDGIRDLVRSRGLGDVYKRQHPRLSQDGFRMRHLAEQSAASAGGLGNQRHEDDPLSLIHI